MTLKNISCKIDVDIKNFRKFFWNNFSEIGKKCKKKSNKNFWKSIGNTSHKIEKIYILIESLWNFQGNMKRIQKTVEVF